MQVALAKMKISSAQTLWNFPQEAGGRVASGGPASVLPEKGLSPGGGTSLGKSPVSPITGNEGAGKNPNSPGKSLSALVGTAPTEESERENERDESTKSNIAQAPSYDPRTLAIIYELRQTDQEVRAHEMAHSSVGGMYVISGPSYQFKSGPDGKRYAVGGEVTIDTAPVPGDPEETKRKMQVVRRAALAPAKPSPQDQAVAAAASRNEQNAEIEAALSKENSDENQTASAAESVLKPPPQKSS